ncbi:MAG: mechanosensitive ion channel family protein [Mangrovibacterium sp.]
MKEFFANLSGSDAGTKFYDLVVTYGLKLIGALVTLIIGWWIISVICKTLRKLMIKKDVDPSLRGFINSMTGIALKAVLIVVCVSMLGVEMTSIVAIFGAAGLAVGMALSGTLQNFAGGVMILLFRPFRVGDFVEAQGYVGSVKEIQIFVTILTTPDNKTVLIPNGPLSNGALINYSRQPRRRVDFSFGIAYGHDFNHAKEVLAGLVKADSRIIQDEDNMIVLGAMADSSVNITVRVWVNTDDYWDVFFDMNKKVYEAFNANDISIPFPQMDVHLDRLEK